MTLKELQEDRWKELIAKYHGYHKDGKFDSDGYNFSVFLEDLRNSSDKATERAYKAGKEETVAKLCLQILSQEL